MAPAQVSVVMAAYNAEKTIAEAIESVLSQTFGDFEFIIVEDGSADGTADVIASFNDPRIRRVRNDQNMGLAPSLQRGLESAGGAYIARIDADDVSYPDRLARQAAFMEAHPDVGVCGTSFDLIDEDSKKFDERVRPFDDEYLQRELLKWNPFCAGSALIRGEVLRALGGYDPRFPTAEDYDLWLRIADVARLAIMGEILYGWRVRPDSMTHGDRGTQLRHAELGRKLAWQRRVTGRDDLGRRVDLAPRERKARRLLAEHCVIWGRQALREHRLASAGHLLSRAFVLDPLSPRLRRAVFRAPSAIARRLFGRATSGHAGNGPPARTTSGKPIVALMRKTYLGRSEVFIYNEMLFSERYDRVVLTTRQENLDIFPWPKVFMPADLPRLHVDWVNDRLSRMLFGRELYFERVCREENVRVLHPHFAYDSVWAMPLKKATGLPMVTSFHGADIYNQANVDPLREEYDELFERGEAFIAMGARMRQRAIDLGCPPERVHIVHYSVNVDDHPFNPRRPIEDKLVLLFCARLIEVKGLRYVIEAMPILKERGVPVEFRAIGYADPPDMDYPALAEELGVADCVTFLGYQPPTRVREEMANCHVFIQPSVTTHDGIIEGAHPTTFCESQAIGCPVIGTRHSDIPEVVREGETGWLVDEKKPEQIADKVQWFYEHPDGLQAFGRRAREHIESRHNAVTEGRKLEDIYAELCDTSTY